MKKISRMLYAIKRHLSRTIVREMSKMLSAKIVLLALTVKRFVVEQGRSVFILKFRVANYMENLKLRFSKIFP